MPINLILFQHGTNISKSTSIYSQLPSRNSCHYWSYFISSSSRKRCLNFALYLTRRRWNSRYHAYSKCDWRQMDKNILTSNKSNRYIQVSRYAGRQIEKGKLKSIINWVIKEKKDAGVEIDKDKRGKIEIPSS